MSGGGDLSADELERLYVFGLGLVVGLVLVGLVRELVRAWVIASDQADRARIREVLAEWFELRQDEPRERAEAAELEECGLTDGSLTERTSRARIAPNKATD